MQMSINITAQWRGLLPFRADWCASQIDLWKQSLINYVWRKERKGEDMEDFGLGGSRKEWCSGMCLIDATGVQHGGCDDKVESKVYSFKVGWKWQTLAEAVRVLFVQCGFCGDNSTVFDPGEHWSKGKLQLFKKPFSCFAHCARDRGLWGEVEVHAESSFLLPVRTIWDTAGTNQLQ